MLYSVSSPYDPVLEPASARRPATRR